MVFELDRDVAVLEKEAELMAAAFDEKELLRQDNSEKVMDVVKIFTLADENEDEDEDVEGNAVGDTVTLDNRVFGVPIRKDVVHRVVVWQRARWRTGTAHTKTRAEVRGGGKRPWKQKGMGKARHGSRRSPLWIGGGKAHGQKRRDFSFKLNKKVRQMGLRVAVAAKYREGNLIIADVDGITSHKTAELVDSLAEQSIWEEDGSVMLIEGDDNISRELKLASQNIPWFSLYPQRGANVYAILKHHRLIITPTALEELTGRLVPVN